MCRHGSLSMNWQSYQIPSHYMQEKTRKISLLGRRTTKKRLTEVLVLIKAQKIIQLRNSRGVSSAARSRIEFITYQLHRA
mmetsp:Transcript_16648/g.27060  ORF Transcript_16648/g.27060 Transcript_16648/m.27060 type:complete len:80 (-) Transcript_16648:10-249(-)